MTDPTPTPTRLGRRSMLTPTLATLIAAALRASTSIALACQHAGISIRTYHAWITRGRNDLLALAEHTGIDPDDLDLTTIPNLDTDWPYVHFLHVTTKARTDYQLENLALIQQAARGYETTTTKTVERLERDPASGQMVAVSRTTETTTRPERQWTASAWLLERRFPDEYARTIRSEVTGRDGGPVQVESAAEMLAARLDQLRVRSEAIDVPSRPIPPETGPDALDGDLGADPGQLAPPVDPGVS